MLAISRFRRTSRAVPLPAAFVVAALILGPAPSAAAVDFIRGDVNQDGAVTVADSVALGHYLFMGSFTPACLESADVDSSRQEDLTDCVKILNYIFFDAPPPAAPFPAPGPDPDPGQSLGCGSYGGGAPLEDPAAKLAILDATAPGGASRLATLTVAVSSSAPTSGYRVRLAAPAGLIEQVGSDLDGLRDLTGHVRAEGGLSFFISRWLDDRLDTGMVIFATPCPGGDLLECDWIPAGADVPILEINACLEPGTPAGEYPIIIEAGELADLQTDRSIQPVLASGTLTVLADVQSGPCDPNPPPPPPPPDVTFRLADRSGAPGATVAVPFSIESKLPSQGFSVSVDFDEGLLEAVRIERLWSKPSGTPFEFEKFRIDNRNEFPQNNGIVEGHIAGAAIFSLTDTSDVLPPGTEVPVLNLHFRIREGADQVATTIPFEDGGLGPDGIPVPNSLIVGGKTIAPATGSAFIFIDGLLRIIPDGIPFFHFIRGDSNHDRQIDISDAVNTLGYLFLDPSLSICLDAADANDDGEVDISDPTATLEYLFLGSFPVLPAPFPEPGEDPTPDGLGCSS